MALHPVGSVDQQELFDGASIAIHNPVLGHRETLVNGLFEYTIVVRTGWRDIFDEQVGHADDAGARQDLLTRCRDDDQIGLRNVMFTQFDVTRCVENETLLGLFNRRVELKLDASRECLVLKQGCRIHIVSSLQDLMAKSVRGDSGVTLVIPFLSGRRHRSLPGILKWKVERRSRGVVGF